MEFFMVYPFELCDRLVRIQWAEDIVAAKQVRRYQHGNFHMAYGDYQHLLVHRNL